MTFDPKAFAQHAWLDFVKSKTFKTVVATETLAVSGFFYGLIDGSVPLTKASFLAFGVTQVAAVVALTIRHALAEIRALTAGQVAPETQEQIEAAVLARGLKILTDKGHPQAATLLQAELAKKGE